MNAFSTPRLRRGIPNIGRLDHLASLYSFCCKASGAESGLVHGAIKWFSKGIAERHVIVKDPRCAALLQYIQRAPITTVTIPRSSSALAVKLTV